MKIVLNGEFNLAWKLIKSKVRYCGSETSGADLVQALNVQICYKGFTLKYTFRVKNIQMTSQYFVVVIELVFVGNVNAWKNVATLNKDSISSGGVAINKW
ncbi:hypothetical protein Bhyg_04120 [Pseudolycoriella hygida]|uniref:Uncharacterized protein n=1 Tax=Pseudolycoriella hygida TaxID=35572 RepID=A0A9Q0NEL5_9DIPT|nr:hypothetical protein Bhyg_04120 [Pseudolycoriella hygida]